MGISPQESSPAVAKTVEEIMRIIKSLPTRPSIDEVDAALCVLKGVEIEEETKLAEIDKFQKPLEVPEELFLVLQEVKKNMVLFQSQEQKREALCVIELDERFQGFDELIQRASKVVCGDTQISKDGDFDDLEIKNEKNSYISDVSLVKKKKEVNREAGVLGVLPRSSSLQAGLSAGGGEEKLSLMTVAGLIETYAKKGVEVLDLQGKLKDQVEWLPQSLGKLFDVTDLNLSENRLLALPSTINDLQYLQRLDLHSNQLINLPDTFGELSNLTDLDLHGNRLRSLPASVGNLNKLTNLDLSSNALSNLPESVGNLTNLKRLNVQTNELEELPYTIGSCTSLIELRLDFNQLKALPEAIGKLGNLEIVSLHYNRIKGLPTTMGSLSKLKELDVTFNELESVPENLCFATSLVRLNVSSNFADLRSLPRSIGNLEMLEEFDISNNQIRVLPLSFRFLSKLRVFNADETPLEIPPKEVVKLGAQAVVQYMADLVVRTEEGPPQAVEKKGCWIWLFSLFQTRRKTEQKRIDSIKT